MFSPERALALRIADLEGVKADGSKDH